MCCSVLQCVAVSCSVLQWVAVCCSVLQCVAVCSSVLQCVAVKTSYRQWLLNGQHTATHCTATHCITLLHTTTQCNTLLQHTTTQAAAPQSPCCCATPLHSNTLQHNTPSVLHHTATHCNTIWTQPCHKNRALCKRVLTWPFQQPVFENKQ